jgi:hypothetical protein
MLNHQELLTLMIKDQNIHSGLWMITFEFQMGTTVAGATLDTAYPTAMVGVSRVGLQKTEVHVNGLCVDAAVVNPMKTTRVAQKNPKA